MTLRMCEKSWACHTVRDHPTHLWSEANSRKLFLRASIRFMIWSQNFDWNSSMYIQCKNNFSLAKWIRGTPLCNFLSRKLAIFDAQNVGNVQKNRQCSVVATSKQMLQFGESTSPNFQSLLRDHRVLLTTPRGNS